MCKITGGFFLLFGAGGAIFGADGDGDAAGGAMTNATSIMPVGKDGTLGDGIAVDKLSVGSDKGGSVETMPACCGRQADNERDRRQTEIRTCWRLKAWTKLKVARSSQMKS